MPTRDEVAREALALPPDDRAYIADVLEQSLTSGEFATVEIAKAWAAEIERRIDCHDRGESRAMDGESAIQRIRQYLAERRAAKANP